MKEKWMIRINHLMVNASKNFEFVKKFEIVECWNSRKIDGKSMNVPNLEGVHKMYR